MLKLTLPNGTIKEYPEGITLLEVSRELNGFFTASRWWKAFLTASARFAEAFAQRRHC